MSIQVYGQETNYICAWEYNRQNYIEYYMKEIIFVSEFTKQEKLMLIFDNFFNRCDNDEVNFVPKDTRLMDVKLYDGHLEVYVSEAIKNYGGGTEWELALVNGLLITAFAIDDVADVTLYINGKIQCLPEGTRLDRYRKEDYNWKESMEEIMRN
jgi:spore germination protein GerM